MRLIIVVLLLLQFVLALMHATVAAGQAPVTLRPDNAMPGQQFGVAVAISGTVTVVGSKRGGGPDESLGSAYVFTLSGSDWIQETKISQSSESGRDYFGSVLALDGNLMVVSTWQGSLAAYVYERIDSGWIQVAIVEPPDSVQPGCFGMELAIQGDFLIMGCPRSDLAAKEAGSVTVFKNEGGSWMPQQTLTASDAREGDRFGSSVALSNSVLLVGRNLDDREPEGDLGGAYVFRFDGTRWNEEAKLMGSDVEEFDRFGGATVGLDGEWAAVPSHVAGRSDDIPGSGVVYMFRRDGEQWREQQKLIAWDMGVNTFGRSLALSGSRLLVGSGSDNAYLFLFDGTEWVRESRLSVREGAQFADKLDLSGERIVMGRWADAENAGSAFVWDLATDTRLNHSELSEEREHNLYVYPNPFSTMTRVVVHLFKAESVTLTLFDLKGRLVSRILGGRYLPPGRHGFALYGSELKSGVYFLEMIVGADRLTRTVVVVS